MDHFVKNKHSKGELVAKKMTMVRVHEDRIKEVLDN